MSSRRLILAKVAWQAMLSHVQQEFPCECCGLLVGDTVAYRYLPLVNELHSETAFRTEPRSLLAAFRLMRAENLNLLALVHSHPTSPPVPSQTDLRENTYEQLPWVIIGPDNNVQAWELRKSDYSAIKLILQSDGTDDD